MRRRARPRSARSPSWPRPTRLDLGTPLRMRPGLRASGSQPATEALRLRPGRQDRRPAAGGRAGDQGGRRAASRSRRASCPGSTPPSSWRSPGSSCAKASSCPLTGSRRLWQAVATILRDRGDALVPSHAITRIRARRSSGARCVRSCAATRCSAPRSRPAGCCSSSSPARGGTPGCATRASTTRRRPRSRRGLAEARRAGAGRSAARAHPAGVLRRWALADCRAGPRVAAAGAATSATPTCSTLPLDGSRPGTRGRRHRSTWCARTASTTRAARCADVRLRRRWPRRAPAGCGSAATSAASASPPTCSCCPAGCCTGGCCRSPRVEFVAATERGEVIGALLRGRIGLKPAAQAALAFAHEHLAVRRARRAVASCRSEQAGPGESLVRIRGPHGLST